MKTLTKILGISALALTITGCKPESTVVMEKETDPAKLIENDSRYTITRVGVFDDDLAFQNKRGIYEITDKETKKTYIGISEIGISELGSHTVGKSIVSDER